MKSNEGIRIKFNQQASSFIEKFQLRLNLTLILQKPYVLRIPVHFMPYNTNEDEIQLMVQIEVINQDQGEKLMKAKKFFRQNTLYIYYPTSKIVDEKQYKILLSNYEAILKQVPRSFRQNFNRLILNLSYEQQQKLKINQTLSHVVRNNIEKKLNILQSELNALYSRQLTIKIFLQIFIVKIKLSYLYQQITLHQNSIQILNTLWSQLMYNCYKLFKDDINSKQFQCPFLVHSIAQVIMSFQQSKHFLRTLSFTFMCMFLQYLEVSQHFNAIMKLKHFLQYTLKHILPESTNLKDNFLKNIWVISIIDYCYDKMERNIIVPIILVQKQQEYTLAHVNICSTYRNAVEKIGFELYNLNTYRVFPVNLLQQIELCLELMQPEKQKKLSAICNYEKKSQQVSSEMKIPFFHKKISMNQIDIFSGKQCPEVIQNIFNCFATYKIVYLKCLYKMYLWLARSPYKKVAWSMKLSVLKSILLYCELEQYIGIVQQILYQIYENEKVYNQTLPWDNLKILPQLYKVCLTFLQSNQQVKAENLIKVILDKNFMTYKKLWLQIIYIMAQSLQLGSILELQVHKEFQSHHLTIKLSNSLMKDIKTLIQGLKQSQLLEIYLSVQIQQQSLDIINQTSKHTEVSFECINLVLQSINCDYNSQKDFIFITGQTCCRKLIIFTVHELFISICAFEKKFNIIYGFPSLNQHNIRLNDIELQAEEHEKDIYCDIWTPITYHFKNLREDTVKLHILQIEILSDLMIKDLICLSSGKDQKYYIPYSEICPQNVVKLKIKQSNSLTIYLKDKNDIIPQKSKKIKQSHNNYRENNTKTKIHLKFTLSHNQYCYRLVKQFEYSLNNAITVDYIYGSEMQEFKISNNSNNILVIRIDNDTDKNHIYTLQKNEELCLVQPEIQVKIKHFSEHQFNVPLNIKSYLKKTCQKNTNTNKFTLKILPNPNNNLYNYKIFEPIRIYSTKVGYIDLNDEVYPMHEKCYQLVGKIKGIIEYIQKFEQGGIINLQIVPIRSGHLVFPSIQIDGCRGIWRDRLYIDLEEKYTNFDLN